MCVCVCSLTSMSITLCPGRGLSQARSPKLFCASLSGQWIVFPLVPVVRTLGILNMKGPCFCFHERHHLAPPFISLSASFCLRKTSTTLPARHVRAVLKLLVVPSPFCPRDRRYPVSMPILVVCIWLLFRHPTSSIHF